MKLTVKRIDFGSNYTGGKLYVDGKYFCDTIEDSDRKLEDGGTKIHGETAIPRGFYRTILDFSQRFGREMPHLLDVPQFEGVRIHYGNSSADSEGCIIVGTNQKGNWVSNSRATFGRLFELMDKAYDSGDIIEVEVL